ncbi:MAG: adenylyl-sulfate kinase [Lachnospiraceae bacterium]|nr:adenylyl-sulfate kinase [Lachnospiraceae bacterium]
MPESEKEKNNSGTSLLKFITCGSVDDGKSTLIGHMLYDAKLLYTDQEQALELDSRVGSRGGEIDYSLLLDGLMAEREQGITIDVAYRYFTTERRSFIVADTPGHEEYTRNMAVGASFADLAVILVDATKGVLIQTRRHTRICALMGIRHFVFAVNKMDLARYDEQTFLALERDLRRLAAEFAPRSVTVIPVSATEGDNITKKSLRMPWYRGPALLSWLEEVDVRSDETETGFVMPVQRVSRPDRTFRGYQGQPSRGTLRVGDEVRVLPGGETAAVSHLYLMDREVEEIHAGTAVTVQLDREIDISRGSVLVHDASVQVGNLFAATILWMDDAPLSAGRNYILKLGTKQIPATVLKIRHKVNLQDGSPTPTDILYKNEIAVCEIAVSDKIAFHSFRSASGNGDSRTGGAGGTADTCDRALGTFILIDRVSNMTSACGTVENTEPGQRNVGFQKFAVTREERAAQKGQKPLTVWFTGLSGSGKSTLANQLEQRLTSMGYHTMLLDGDNVRLGLNRDLGFQEADRVENIRRAAEVAKLMNDAGLIVLTSFISPFESDRRRAREIIGEGFFEIHVSTPLAECERRDVKGLYAKARRGEIAHFTGISSPFEEPQHAAMRVDTSETDVKECVEKILKQIEPLIRLS